MITLVVGTRPEIIKVAPVVHELQRRQVDFQILHTGQHYTRELDVAFFEELSLPQPAINLKVGSLPAPAQVAAIVLGVGEWLANHQTDWVLVQGDTNSVLGGALAAFKSGVPVAHLEAGLRSDDWEMPEEGNRVLAGRMSSVHFCPTAKQQARLALEGIRSGVFVVGNTIVDAVLEFSARDASATLAALGLEKQRYAFLTLHRPANVDVSARLSNLLRSLGEVARGLDLQMVFAVHPRTRARLVEGGLEARLDPRFRLLEPLGYVQTLALVRNAALLFTDSGGLQEEACSLRVPCITLRANTERPETLEVGANQLVEADDSPTLMSAARAGLARARDWPNPFGDGNAARRVVEVLMDPTTPRRPVGAQ